MRLLLLDLRIRCQIHSRACLLPAGLSGCLSPAPAPLLTRNGMFRFTISKVRWVKLASAIKKSRATTPLPLQMRCHVTLTRSSALRRCVFYPPSLRSRPAFAPLSFRLLSLSCRLCSLLPSLSHRFLPLHHHLAVFSPFSPQPDGSQMRRLSV